MPEVRKTIIVDSFEPAARVLLLQQELLLPLRLLLLLPLDLQRPGCEHGEQ